MDAIKSFLQISLTFASVIWSLLRPPVMFFAGKIAKVLFWYKKLWVKYTHNKYEEFVYKRGVLMASATLAALVVIPTLLLLLLQSTYYLATYKKESIYLIQSEEIYPDDNIWGVRGCYNQNCDSNSSVYFRIRPALFHHLWSLTHEGGLFLPDMIGSSVPTGWTRCEVTSYGIRSRVLMSFHVYPSILKITCDGSSTLGNQATRPTLSD